MSRSRKVSHTTIPEAQTDISDEELAFCQNIKERVNIRPNSASNSPRGSIIINGTEHTPKPEWVVDKYERQIRENKEKYDKQLESHINDVQSAILSLEKRMVILETRVEFIDKEGESCCLIS